MVGVPQEREEDRGLIEPASAAALTQSEMDAAAIAERTWDKFAAISPEDEKHQIALAQQAAQQAYNSGVNLEEFEEILRNNCPPSIQASLRDQFIRQVEAEGRKPENTRDQQRTENDKVMQQALGGVGALIGVGTGGAFAGFFQDEDNAKDAADVGKGIAAGGTLASLTAGVPIMAAGKKSLVAFSDDGQDMGDLFSLKPMDTPSMGEFQRQRQAETAAVIRGPKA